ncbi:hypothetical protein N7523_008177 [Penicillium sp. IBT 18751x]|nr:hypothetical protein N7523_008177 [Penicillium sp. IBT 18751x]
MLPNYPYAQGSHRMAPPVRPSRSLEGLERVIPPSKFPTRDLFLNKPLPAKPVPDEPAEYSSGMWSDSSDSESESTVDSVSPSEPRNSTESYPIFVSSDSDDFNMVDHPVPVDQLSLGPIRPSPQRFLTTDSRTDSIVSGVSAISVVSRTDSVAEPSDAQYGRPSHWTQGRTGTNHYFREKKWDFFPELATPSALQASGRVSPGIKTGKSRKKEGRLNLAAKRRRWHSLDRAGLGLAHGVRDSIKTYVHRTLSKDSGEGRDTKAKGSPRPRTAPFDSPDNQEPYPRPKTQQSSTDLSVQLRTLSISTASSPLESPSSPRSIHTQCSAPLQRPKQLAVPMSPYQKYGSAVWETPKKSKSKLTLHLSPHPDGGPSSPDFIYANPTPPLSPPFKTQLQQNTRNAARALQDGTCHVLVALDGAKRKISESKDERRREALKSQIKLIGPVNSYSYNQGDPWV